MATVAITGASRGIGLELARQHAAQGDQVFALARGTTPALDELIASSGGLVSHHTMEVGDDASVKAGAASTGDGKIDILYNVAGVSGPHGPEIESANFAEWSDVFNVNVNGPMRTFQAFLPRLGEGSRVVSFGSQVGASTWPYPGFEVYAASKAALHQLMHAVALGVADRGIITVSVHPGWVKTDMGGPDAELTVEESAGGIRTLAEGLTQDMSGGFYKWNGEAHAW